MAVPAMLVVAVVLLGATIAVADEPKTGFFDLYGGLISLPESDIPDWKFASDVRATVGARTGMWLNEHWAVTLRGWHFQTDAKQRESSPSDLAFLGVSLELLGRWQLDRRWAVYGSLGPAMAITTLDLQRADGHTEDDARSIAPGLSFGAGVEAHLVGRFSAFTEIHGALVYPSFRFPNGTISPRLLPVEAVVGVRLGF
jgi:hypothetical protein